MFDTVNPAVAAGQLCLKNLYFSPSYHKQSWVNHIHYPTWSYQTWS